MSSLRGSTLEGSKLACKFYCGLKVTNSGKHSSLFRCVKNHGHIKILVQAQQDIETRRLRGKETYIHGDMEKERQREKSKKDKETIILRGKETDRQGDRKVGRQRD